MIWRLVICLIACTLPASAQLFNITSFDARPGETTFSNSGQPWSLLSPVIYAENYDTASQPGIAFRVPNSNTLPACQATTYRTDAANLQASTDGPNFQIGCAATGTFYQYIINVPSPSPCPCTVMPRLGSPSSGGSWAFYIDDTLIGAVATPNTGSYTAMQPVNSMPFNVNPGNHTVRWQWASGDANGYAGSMSSFQFSLPATTDPTAGLLAADRDAYSNWKMAGLQSIGGIPNRPISCGTVNPIGGGSDDTANINTAITNCAAGQFVNLSSGTFTIAEGSYILLNKGVSLRGQGAGSTILSRATGPGSWANQAACSSSGAWGATLGCSNSGNNPSPAIIASPLSRFVANNTTGCALTADGAAGAASVTVSSGCASRFTAGQIVLLDELTGAGWQTDVEYNTEQIWASQDYRIVTHIHNPTLSGDDCTTLPPTPSNCSVLGTTFTVHNDSLTNEIKRVASVSGNMITFDSPLTISYRVSHTAQLWSYATPFLLQAGIENLTVQNADSNGIEWDWCAYCWAQGVEVTNWLGRGFELQQAFRTQLEGDYVHEGAWCVPGSGGYNIGIDFASSEILIENSISRACNKVIVVRAAGAGSVAGYNYMDDGYIAGTTGWVEAGLNASHLVGSHHMLFEGNWGFNTESDNTHGASNHNTFFRNNISGIRETFTGEDGVVRNDGANCGGATASPMRGLGAHVWAWWTSNIGNVVGTSGCAVPSNGWRLKGTFATNLNIHMYGWDDENVVGNNSFADPNLTTIYPAVGPNCPAASNCSTIDANNWIQWPASTASVFSVQSNVTLSNGNLTATNGTSTGSDIQVNDQSFVSGASQKIYYEMTCTAALGNLGFGYANAGHLNTYLGQDANSAGYYNGAKFISGGGNISSPTWDDCVTGDTVGIMLDATVSPMQLFIRTYHSGAWNAKWNVTTEAQPTAGGYNVTATNVTTSQTLFPTLSVKNTGEAGTICGNAACGVSPPGLPTGAVWFDTTQNFSQPPPATFASSFYLSSRPAFFTSCSIYPWPWVTPEDGPTTPIQSGPAGCGGTCSGLPAKARWDSCVAASTVTAACIVGMQP